MKNITLSADESLIAQAREEARARHTTLNSLFRDWLAELTAQAERSKRVDELLNRLSYANSGGKFSREEMNER
ncbi:MAG: hypothetical protein QM627_08460 [Luteolibacter sp.]